MSFVEAQRTIASAFGGSVEKFPIARALGLILPLRQDFSSYCRGRRTKLT